MLEVIRFPSHGLDCAADLLLPEEDSEDPAPALVIGRGFGGVREGNRREAQYLCSAGFVVLSIDYRWFGESQGEPRGRLRPLDQVEDFRNGITFLESRPEVDVSRIGLWGTSFAGGVVLHTAAVDRRVKVVVAQLPIVDGGRWLRSLRPASQWDDMLHRLRADRELRDRGEPGQRIKLSGSARIGEFAVMPGDDEQAAHFANLKRTQPTWREDITLESLESVLEFRPIDVVDRIAPRASCIVTAAGHDPVHPLDQILEAFARCREPKKLHLLPEGGLELRFDPLWTRCMAHALDWFRKYLDREGGDSAKGRRFP